MNWKYLKKLALRFVILNIVLWGLIGISVPLLFSGPHKYSYTDSDWDDFSFKPNYNESRWNVLLDGHSHTKYSDGHLTPRQNILWHVSLGFNAMVLTDHNTFDGINEIRQIAREEYNDTIKVLVGMEWTTDKCHLNVIVPPDTTEEDWETLLTSKSSTYTPSDAEIQNLISLTHSIGGLVVVNHYLWSQSFCRDQPSRQQFYDWGVDYIEVINENEFDNESYYFCLDNNVGIITGSDMHHAEPVYAWTTLNVSEFSEQAIFDELKAKRTDFIFTGIASPYDVDHKINPTYIIGFPLIKFGEMFKEMYSSEAYGAQLTVFLVYVYGAFIVVEVLRFFVPKIKKKIKDRKKVE